MSSSYRHRQQQLLPLRSERNKGHYYIILTRQKEQDYSVKKRHFSEAVFLKDNAGLGDQTFVTVSPAFTKTSVTNRIPQNYFDLPILLKSV